MGPEQIQRRFLPVGRTGVPVKPFPPTGYRMLDARSAFFYGITGITPVMSMRPPGTIPCLKEN
jgi:hypothetical protein